MYLEHFNKNVSEVVHLVGFVLCQKAQRNRPRLKPELCLLVFLFHWGLPAMRGSILMYSILSHTGWCFLGHGMYLFIKLTHCFISDQLTMWHTKARSCWMIVCWNQTVNIFRLQRKAQKRSSHAKTQRGLVSCTQSAGAKIVINKISITGAHRKCCCFVL